MKIHLATDHAGFRHKEAVKQWLTENGYEPVDHGAYREDMSDDYTDFIPLAAREVSKNPDTEKAIIFGHSGQGEAISANRFPHVRTTVYYGNNENILLLSRKHNNANILSLAGAFMFEDEAIMAIKIWLNTPFSGEERHVRRNNNLELDYKKYFYYSEKDTNNTTSEL